MSEAAALARSRTAPDPLAVMELLLARAVAALEVLSAEQPQVGPTAKQGIHIRHPMIVHHYLPKRAEVYRVPTLLVTAITNRGYIFDLAPGHSVVEYLLDCGFDVYMLEWQPVMHDERHLSFSDYVLDLIPDGIRRVQAHSGEPEVSLVSYCAGGVMSLISAALNPDGPIRNLVCLTTPVDFRHMRLFRAWTDRRHLDLDRLVATLGNVPPELTTAMFEMLRPASRMAGLAQLWENGCDKSIVQSYRLLNRWSYDALWIAAGYFQEGIRALFWDNLLCQNRLVLGGETADLRRIRIPVFHGVAGHDHIVPRESSRALVELVSSKDTQEVVVGGGHLSVVAGRNATRRLWPRVSAWLAERSV